jgi:hypothetical protein
MGGATKTTANNELNDMNDMNYRKEMAVGRSKSKLSQKINKWSHHTTIEDNIPPEQQCRAAATTKEENLVPPLLDNGEGKQQCLDIDYKSTRDKFDEKEEQTNKQPANDMASVIEQSTGSVAKAKHQASPTHQCGINHSQSSTPTPQGAATLFKGACPTVKKTQKEIPNNLGLRIHECPSPTVNIPNKEGTSQEVMRNMEGLKPPTFDLMGKVATGAETEWLRLQIRKRRYALQDGQDPTSMWTTHTGNVRLPPKTTLPQKYLNEMCPQGLATSHPAGELLAEWSQLGCPTKTGRPWSNMEMWEAIERGPTNCLSPQRPLHISRPKATRR